MSEKRYVPQGVYLVCDKGVKPSELKGLSHCNATLFGEYLCTKVDKLIVANFASFGACSCANGAPCTAPVLNWTNVSDGITLGGNELLLENSELPCSLGGKIKIFYSLQDALAACPKPKKSFWETIQSIHNKYQEFNEGVVLGLWKGLKGLVTGVVDLVVWSGKHHPIYQLANPTGYAEQLVKDTETAKALGNLAKKGGTWVYRNSNVNLALNPADYHQAQVENMVMAEKLYEKAKDMSPKDWGELTGQVGFEIVQDVATAGLGAYVTGLKIVDKTVDVAKVVNKLDNAVDTGKALDKIEDAGDVSKGLDELGDMVKKVDDMSPGSPAHKAQRWEDYKGDWNFERWSKQYDVNMKNNSYGLGREKEYRKILGGISKMEKTKFTNRQIDIAKLKERYLGQLKTGKHYLTKQAKIDIKKDAWLVKYKGYKVEYILEKGGSKPLLEALKKNGIDYHIGKKIP